MTPFEQHIDDCIASEVGLAQALQRDGFGDYTVPWVASKHKAGAGQICLEQIRTSTKRGGGMSCCDLSVFMDDFNHYFKQFFDHAPTEQQLKKARSDWRAGNTGYEGAHNADFRAKVAIVKANERLVNIGGNNYAHEGSDLARRYQESNK